MIRAIRMVQYLVKVNTSRHVPDIMRFAMSIDLVKVNVKNKKLKNLKFQSLLLS